MGTHQPPEMQTQASYAGITRTPNHDRFGLAVLIFQLLCMNRHPFSGRFHGQGEPPTIEEAIKGFIDLKKQMPSTLRLVAEYVTDLRVRAASQFAAR